MRGALSLPVAGSAGDDGGVVGDGPEGTVVFGPVGVTGVVVDEGVVEGVSGTVVVAIGTQWPGWCSTWPGGHVDVVTDAVVVGCGDEVVEASVDVDDELLGEVVVCLGVEVDDVDVVSTKVDVVEADVDVVSS
jgi:hypothetical protein